MSSRNKHLVIGYIRQIQNSLSNDKIIPTELYNLCCLFYRHSIRFPFQEHDEELGFLNIGIYDVDTNQAFMINSTKYIECPLDVMCHIPDISYLLPNDMTNSKKSLGGIFGTSMANPMHKDTTPYLLLYQQDETKKVAVNNVQISSVYISKIPLSTNKCPKQFLYSNSMNKIIYQDLGRLYEFDLMNIHSTNDFEISKFNQIKQSKQIFKLQRIRYEYEEYLKMICLENKKSIFAMRCRVDKTWSWNSKKLTTKQRYVECGIFEMDKCCWSNIKRYKYYKPCTGKKFECEMCHDENNSIYMFSHTTDIAKYDIHKNEWKEVCIKPFKYCAINKGIFWIENQNILYYVSGIKLKSYDLRNNVGKWNVLDDIKRL